MKESFIAPQKLRYGLPVVSVPNPKTIAGSVLGRELRNLLKGCRGWALLLGIFLGLQVSTAVASPFAESASAEAGFGPQITIEFIEISGNSSTSDRVIKDVLSISQGDVLQAGSAALRLAKYRVLALGFFREVKLSLAKGSRRGMVVLVVEVEERGTIALNRLFFGTANFSPWWFGLDLSERNFLGTGIAVAGAFVVVGQGNAEGAKAQQSVELRASRSELFGTRLSWYSGLYGIRASEPYRVAGENDDSSLGNFKAFDYSRMGVRGGIGLSVLTHSQLSLGARLERVFARLPAGEERVLPSGERVAIQTDLLPGASYVTTVSLGFDRDTRSDPVLTQSGNRFQLQGEAGAKGIAGDYDFATLLAKYQHYWPIGRGTHVVSMHLSGGAVLGDVPLFERLHVGDINRMVSARAMGLVTSTTPSLDILATSTDEIRYGEVGGLAEVQYSYRLFKSRNKMVYGGEFFVGGGLWTLLSTGQLDPRDSPPLDILLDVGVRLDTEIGVFELSLANALGRLPL